MPLASFPLVIHLSHQPEERVSMAWSRAGVSPVWHARLIEAFERWPALAHGIQPECPSTLDTQHSLIFVDHQKKRQAENAGFFFSAHLGGGFKYLLFSALFGEDSPF